MDLNFSKKTRKIVASLLAVAILLGVLPVSGLTGNSSVLRAAVQKIQQRLFMSIQQNSLYCLILSVILKKLYRKLRKTFTVQKLKMVTRLLYLPI